MLIHPYAILLQHAYMYNEERGVKSLILLSREKKDKMINNDMTL